MPFTGTIDGPYLNRQYLGLPNTQDIQLGVEPPLALDKQNNVNGSGATVTLTAAQSGSTILFDRATGIVFTLPAPSVGLIYKFYVSTTISSGSAKVITNAGTVFILGNIVANTANATPAANDGPKTFAANGTTHLAITQSGTTTGGVVGSWFELECVSSTIWVVKGVLLCTGIIATPFATS